MTCRRQGSRYLPKAREILSEIKNDQHILFIPRVILIDNQYITISKLIKINKKNKEDLLNNLIDSIGLSNEAYKTIPPTTVGSPGD